MALQTPTRITSECLTTHETCRVRGGTKRYGGTGAVTANTVILLVASNARGHTAPCCKSVVLWPDGLAEPTFESRRMKFLSARPCSESKGIISRTEASPIMTIHTEGLLAVTLTAGRRIS